MTNLSPRKEGTLRIVGKNADGTPKFSNSEFVKYFKPGASDINSNEFEWMNSMEEVMERYKNESNSAKKIEVTPNSNDTQNKDNDKKDLPLKKKNKKILGSRRSSRVVGSKKSDKTVSSIKDKGNSKTNNC